MALLSDTAVVLRRLDYSETSQILVLFTREHGKVRVIAKGIKRGTKTRFAPAIDLLEIGRVVWSARSDRERNLSTLTEWKQDRPSTGIRESLLRLYSAQYAAEIASELTADDDPHPILFDELVQLLDRICISSDPIVDLCLYLRAMLTEVGYWPQAGLCISCKRELIATDTGQVYFSSHQGGFLCRDCESNQPEKYPVHPTVARVLGSNDWANVSPWSVLDVLNYHISHLMGKPPQLWHYLTSVRRN